MILEKEKKSVEEEQSIVNSRLEMNTNETK